MTFLLGVNPRDLSSFFDKKVAVTSEADPSVFTVGVGTLDLVLPTEAFTTQVAAKVTLEARPEGN